MIIKCTCLIYVHNDQQHLTTLINSLKRLNPGPQIAFIFIDDGSYDRSLQKIRNLTADMSRVTIITQPEEGPAIAFNKAAKLVKAGYLCFMRGHEKLHPEAINALIASCQKFKTEAAVGCARKQELERLSDSEYNITNPLEQLLTKKTAALWNLGNHASIVSAALFHQLKGFDQSLFIPSISLALKIAKNHRVAHLNQLLTQLSMDLNVEPKFIVYNNLQAIYNFIKQNPEIIESHNCALQKTLKLEKSIIWPNSLGIITSFFRKYTKKLSADELLSRYQQALDKLF